MSAPVLLIEKKDGIATLTLNRPKSMNALSTELMRAISGAIDDLKDDPSIGVVILTGAGRAFCAGLDLKELSNEDVKFEEPEGGKSLEANLAKAIENLGLPVIGAINGAAITGGFELALACDILVASTEARFADTHARVGIIPGWGLSQKLSRIVGILRAKEISLTGNFIDAKKAEAWGLVNRVVEPDALMPTCYNLARDIVSCPRDMVIKYKGLIDQGYRLSFGDSVELEEKTHIEHFQSVTSASIASRKESVIKRGRQQK